MHWIVVGKDEPSEVRGGLNRYVSGLTEALIDQGASVSLNVAVCTDGGVSGNAAARMATFFGRGWRAALSRADIVNLHFALYGAPFLAGMLLRNLLRRKKSPVIMTHFHGPWSQESAYAAGRSRLGVTERMKRLLEIFTLRMSDRIIVLSEAFGTVLERQFRIPQDKVWVVRPGVSNEWFQPHQVSTRSEDHISVVVVRRLTPRMGHIAFLDLLEEIDFRVDDTGVQVSIIGTGRELETIESWIREHSRLGEVRIVGGVSDAQLREYVAGADVSAIPTLELEGFGLVVLEAYAAGTPVISTGQGGLAEAMGPWATDPWIFALDDASTLAKGIGAAHRAKSDPSQLAQMRSYANRHSWAATIEQLEVIVRGAQK